MIGDVVRKAVTAAFVQANNHYEEIARSQLCSGEMLVSIHLGETKPPFIVRILPFVPDLLTRAKKYLLAITDRRVLIIRLTNPFNALAMPTFKNVAASIPHAKLTSVEPSTGPLTSSLTIRAGDAGRFRFVDMLRSAAESFAADLAAARLTESNTHAGRSNAD